MGSAMVTVMERQDRMTGAYSEALIEAMETLGTTAQKGVRQSGERREKRVEAVALAQISAYDGDGPDALEWIEVLEKVVGSNGWLLELGKWPPPNWEVVPRSGTWKREEIARRGQNGKWHF